MVRKFQLLACVYYDDFPIFEFQPLIASTTQLLQTLLDLLGWRRATTGKKATNFANVMTVLGVDFNLQSFWRGKAEVYNKPSRIGRMETMLKSFAEKGSITSGEASRMRGLMNFAGGFVMGRAIKPVSRLFAVLQHGTNDKALVKTVTNASLEILMALRPRVLTPCKCFDNFVIYTDGAYEKGSGTWGAVVCDSSTKERFVHHGDVPGSILACWTRSSAQVIAQLELFAVLLVRFHYRRKFQSRPFLLFVDNEATRYTLLREPALQNPCSRWPSRSILLMPSFQAYERVHTKSNIGDLPSRSLHKEGANLIGGTCAGDISLPQDLLNKLCET